MTTSQQKLVPGRMVRDLVMLKVRHKRGGQAVELSPEALAAIADLPCLERLYLERSDLDNDGLRHIAKVKTLRRLAIWGSNVTDTGLSYLVALSELEVLDVHDTGVTLCAAEWLVQFPKLHTVRPNMNSGPTLVPGEFLRYVARRPKLFCPDKRLAVEVQGLRLDDLQLLAGMEGIELLRFGTDGESGAVPRLPEGGLRYVAMMPDLKELVLPPGLRDGEAVGRLGGTQIEEILGCPVAALPHLTGTSSIRHLWFAEPRLGEEFDPEVLVHLRDLPNLEILDINALCAPYLDPRDPGKSAPREAVDTIMGHVLACPRLRRFGAGFWKVGDNFFVEAAKHLPHLEYLCVSLRDDVTLSGLRNLKALPLQEFVLWRPSPETTKAIITLRAEMPDCRIVVVN